MNKLFQISMIYMTFGLGGCGHDAHEHGHDHDHDHDHGTVEDAGHKPQHDGGFLVQAKEHYANIEIVPEFEEGRLHLYLFDGCVEKPVRCAQEQITVTLELPDGPREFTARPLVNALTGEKGGNSSQFMVHHKDLAGAGHLKGSIASILFLGETYTDLAFDTDPATHDKGYYGTAPSHDDHEGHDHDEGHEGDHDEHADHDHDESEG